MRGPYERSMHLVTLGIRSAHIRRTLMVTYRGPIREPTAEVGYVSVSPMLFIPAIGSSVPTEGLKYRLSHPFVAASLHNWSDDIDHEAREQFCGVSSGVVAPSRCFSSLSISIL